MTIAMIECLLGRRNPCSERKIAAAGRYVSTTDDPAIEKLAEEQAGTVYGTDAIFSFC